MATKTRYCPNCNLITLTSEETCRHCGYNFLTNKAPTDKTDNSDTEEQNESLTGFDKEIKQKIDYWQTKLIDLSRRNNLVSHRFTKSKSIKLEYPEIEQTIRDIHNKSNIRFHKKGDEEEELENTSKYWATTEDDKTTNKKLYNLYLKARENFQELGVNTCFIGLGLLHYRNNEWTDDFNQSPILMCPIEIDRLKSVPTKYHRFEIDPDFADIHVNPAFKEKLSNEWGIALKDLEEGSSPLDYFEYLETMISSLKDWSIEKSVVIAFFRTKNSSCIKI